MRELFGNTSFRGARSREPGIPRLSARDSGSAPSGASRNDVLPNTKTRRDYSRRVPTFVLAGPGAESARLQSLKKLSGRSQRGDSAWCKTLDHLLSLLVEISIYAVNRALLRGRNRGMNC